MPNEPSSIDHDIALLGPSSLDNIHAPEGLDEMLKEVAKRELTKEETRAQRISFILGMLPQDSTITREYIEEMVDGQRW
jgi:hypothetical protein